MNIFLFVLFSISISKPLVSNVQGTFKDTESITIMGSGFGAKNVSLVEWFGGKNGSIETTRLKEFVDLENWFVGDDSGDTTFNEPFVDRDMKFSYGRSIRSTIRPHHKWGGFMYYPGRSFKSIFASWWVYLKISYGQTGTYTGFRLRKKPGIDPSSGVGEEHNKISSRLVTNCGDESCLHAGYTSGSIPVFKWTRINFFARASHNTSTEDGTMEIEFIVPGKRQYKNFYKVKTSLDAIPYWRYFIIENGWTYSGNDKQLYSHYYIDDVFLQLEMGKARVEFGNERKYLECTKLIIQKAYYWNDDRIKVEANIQNFDPGETVYAFVVDEYGNVNEVGMKITAGSVLTLENLIIIVVVTFLVVFIVFVLVLLLILVVQCIRCRKVIKKADFEINIVQKYLYNGVFFVNE